MDRRFGEDDPNMTPEQKALERFVKEKQNRDKKNSMFDLEDDEETTSLTHAGRSLSFGKPVLIDAFDDASLNDSEEEQTADPLLERPSKRRRVSNASSSAEDLTERSQTVHSERAKTKKEVMEEVIAKSRLHRYERQQAKEDDEDLRAELDKGLPDLYALLRGTPKAPLQPHLSLLPNAGMDPDRLALLNGKDRSQADKEYDERLRQMAMDQRAKPSVPTLTEEGKLNQEAHRLQKLEVERLRRMHGKAEESESEAERTHQKPDGDKDGHTDDEDAFGLGSGLLSRNQKTISNVEDEDDFFIEDDLVTSASQLDVSDMEPENEPEELIDGDDEEFVQGLLSKEDAGREGLVFTRDQSSVLKAEGPVGNLAYTYNCPQSQEELLDVTKDVATEDLPTVVQRIRALYHPQLASENKAKLSKFATALVDHISYLANRTEHPPFAVLETLIRHIHSLAKLYPDHVGRAFRKHLSEIHERRPTSLNPGDLVILTAISAIFPTSDHFHQVVTPAMLCMSRYLDQNAPCTLRDLIKGAYVLTLCLQYQRLSKRYIPEAVKYVLTTLWALAPVKPKHFSGVSPNRTIPDIVRLRRAQEVSSKGRRLTFWDVLPSVSDTDEDDETLKIALLNTHLALIENMALMWTKQSAFCEVFDPIHTALRFLGGKCCSTQIDHETIVKIRNVSGKIHTQLRESLAARKPLLLHNHRPLAIKTSIPKFEESYNPDKHYDPDRDRAEVSKLKAEHKRERKGALRELRKDANFIARESLREKKEKDNAYEKKYKRLVAEIQGEEGREGKNYEREKRLRKGKK